METQNFVQTKGRRVDEDVILAGKQPFLFLLNQNTNEIKEDISIVMFNISNYHKAVIWWTEFMQTLKNRSFFYDLIKTILWITRLMPT